MNRRDVLKSSLFSAGSLAVPASMGAQSQNDKPQPAHIWPHVPTEINGGGMPTILWICTDMQRYDTIEGLNNDSIHTPNLRRLMTEGVTLTHTFVQSPVCSPSR